MIAQLHRTLGLQAYVDRNGQLAVQAFAASRAIEPDFSFPLSEVPAGHPIRADFTAMDPSSSRLVEVPPAKAGRVEIDGVEAAERPDDRPVVFQRFGRGGAVADTAWVAPGAPLPPYEIAHPLDPATRGLLLGGASSTGAAAILLVAARISLSDWTAIDASTPEGQSRLTAGRSRTNALLGAAGAAGGLAGLAGVLAAGVQLL